jgi:hypothetical protein
MRRTLPWHTASSCLGRTGEELGPCQRAHKTLRTASCNPLHHQVLPAMHSEGAWQQVYSTVQWSSGGEVSGKSETVCEIAGCQPALPPGLRSTMLPNLRGNGVPPHQRSCSWLSFAQRWALQRRATRVDANRALRTNSCAPCTQAALSS